MDLPLQALFDVNSQSLPASFSCSILLQVLCSLTPALCSFECNTQTYLRSYSCDDDTRIPAGQAQNQRS